MKHIKYERMLNSGSLQPVTIDYNEINERIAEGEAYNGTEIYDDGMPEPEPADKERIAELETALELLPSGGDGMKPELREKTLAYNRSVKEKATKASDLDIIVSELLKLPYGQLKKVLTDDVLAVLKKYGILESEEKQ